MKSAYTSTAAAIDPRRAFKQPDAVATGRMALWGVAGLAAAAISACGGNDDSAAEQAALVAQGQQIVLESARDHV